MSRMHIVNVKYNNKFNQIFGKCVSNIVLSYHPLLLDNSQYFNKIFMECLGKIIENNTPKITNLIELYEIKTTNDFLNFVRNVINVKIKYMDDWTINIKTITLTNNPYLFIYID